MHRGRGTFTVDGATLQQQYPKGGQDRSKSTCHQIDGLYVSIEILQNTFTSSEFFPIKIKQMTNAGWVKHFVKNWQKLTNDPMILDVVRGYKFYFTANIIKAIRSVSLNQRSNRPSGSGGPEHVDEGCYGSFESQ